MQSFMLSSQNEQLPHFLTLNRSTTWDISKSLIVVIVEEVMMDLKWYPLYAFVPQCIQSVISFRTQRLCDLCDVLQDPVRTDGVAVNYLAVILYFGVYYLPS